MHRAEREIEEADAGTGGDLTDQPPTIERRQFGVGARDGLERRRCEARGRNQIEYEHEYEYEYDVTLLEFPLWNPPLEPGAPGA